MKKPGLFIAIMVALLGFTAAGMQALYAQATPKAYIVTELELIHVDTQQVYSPRA
jgi:hypothetical protein